MIEAKFGIPEIASRTLELYVTGVLSATLQPEQAAPRSWRESLERMAQTSAGVYRGLVREDPDFLEYFHHATPIEELGHLRIGSRPARRKPGRDVAALRAIPWIFSWTQMRLMTPSWLGVAEALEGEWSAGHGATLAEMYERWPFFRSTLDLIEMTLAKTEPRITAEYDARLVPEALRAHGVDLRERRNRAAACIRKLSGTERLLASNPVLRRSIDVRNPYVDPINLVQIELLHRLRSGQLSAEDTKELRHALLVTFNGVAAGMRNTG
jgi:phosphoenolpyruvate carboxylase